MTVVLLTGAGFSFNWGARLSREVNTAIAMRVQADIDLVNLLGRHSNFEDALSELQQSAIKTSATDAQVRLQKLEGAISDVFGQMNRNLARVPFNWSNDLKYSWIGFLARFDAIFTLNQDLLLETHYLNPAINLALAQTRKWDGGVIPATTLIPSMNGGLIDPQDFKRIPEALPEEKEISSRHQPYFKLHGSTNWYDIKGTRLLVLGGNKSSAIKLHPILTWYATKLFDYLSRPGARLMVMGYGFRDEHINNIIVEAWEKSGHTLRMFIVDPAGRDILRKINKTYGGAIYAREPLEEITTFESSRSLKSTFNGDDPAEHETLVERCCPRSRSR